MALEDDILTLVNQTTTLNTSVDTLLQSVSGRFEALRRQLPFDFIVSSRVPESSDSAQSIAGILQKVSAKRATEPTGADPLQFPRPVTVYVDGRPSDSLPIPLTLANVEFVLSFATIFTLATGQAAFNVTAQNVAIKGGRFSYATFDATNIYITTQLAARTLVRSVTAYNGAQTQIQAAVGVGFAGDNVNIR
jgi:hypothetical protein